MLRITFSTLVIVGTVFAAHLPNNFRKCHLSAPKLNKCLTKSAIAAWATIVEGDKSRHILRMDPLNVPFLHFPVHENLKGNVTEAFIYGLQNMKINDVNVNLTEKTFDARFIVPRLTLFGNYDVTGKVLGMFPIMGQGIVNFTLYDMESHLHIDYELTKNKENHYITVTNNRMEYNTTKLFFHLTNLFGGDKMLGDITNQILNDNWESMNNEIGSKVAEVFGETFTEITKSFFKNVSIEEIFSN